MAHMLVGGGTLAPKAFWEALVTGSLQALAGKSRKHA